MTKDLVLACKYIANLCTSQNQKYDVNAFLEMRKIGLIKT